MEKGKIAGKVATGFLGAAGAVAMASSMGVKVDGIITRISKIFIYFGWFAFFISLVTYIGMLITHWDPDQSISSNLYVEIVFIGTGFWILVICYLLAGLWILSCKSFMWIFAGATKLSQQNSGIVLETKKSNRIDELEKRIKELESK